MPGSLKLPVVAVMMCMVSAVHAQSHQNVWFRASLGMPIGKKFKVDTEFQHRRQNGVGHPSPFYNNLMFTFRTWFHYQHSPNLKFSVSPFAYFSHYPIIQKKADETASPNTEIRLSAAIDAQPKLWGGLHLVQRTAIEYRWWGYTQANVIRFRNRLGCRYDFTPKVRLAIYDELFVNVSKMGSAGFFDHNRFGGNLEYGITRNLKIEMGYIHSTRLLAQGNTLHENNLFVNVYYTLGQ